MVLKEAKMELCVLASGSGGNCSIIRTEDGGVFLIDCGLGPRVTAQRLASTGVDLKQMQAICVTHLDHDHFNPAWTATIIKLQIKVFCPSDRVHDMMASCTDERLRALIIPFSLKEFEPVPGVCAIALRMAHDRTGSHAFRFTADTGSIGYATDLGRVPPALIGHFCGVDIVAIESNYDPEMQRMSGRPLFLQQRIMNGGGHLSNKQAMAAVKLIFDRCAFHGYQPPRQVVLLHRSRQCNCPKLLKAMFETDVRFGTRVVLSEQYSCTEWLSTQRAIPAAWVGQQLSLNFG